MTLTPLQRLVEAHRALYAVGMALREEFPSHNDDTGRPYAVSEILETWRPADLTPAMLEAVRAVEAEGAFDHAPGVPA